MNFILGIIGYIILFYAIDYKRGPESKIETFSKDYWIIMLMVFVGTLLIS